jgi:hypothetical protein
MADRVGRERATWAWSRLAQSVDIAELGLPAALRVPRAPDPSDPAKSWIESAREVFQVLLGGDSQERAIVRRRPNGWQIQSRLQRFKHEGTVLKHISRIEAHGGIWPPLEFDQFYESANAARAVVEAAAIKRQSAREQFAQRRDDRLKARPDLKELEDDTTQLNLRVDRLLASRFSQLVAAISAEKKRPDEGRRSVRRYRFDDGACVLYRLDRGLRLQAVIRCDVDGCDVFTIPELPTDEREGVSTLLRGLTKYLPIDAKGTSKRVPTVVRNHPERHGWETFVVEWQKIVEAESRSSLD